MSDKTIFFPQALLYAILVIHCASASRVIFPPGLAEFSTPPTTNGFVGAPTDFSVIANITISHDNCGRYLAEGLFVMFVTAPCSRQLQYEMAKQAGAVGLIICDYESKGVGRRARAPISDKPLEIPVVVIALPEYMMLADMLEELPYVTLEITPGANEWMETVGNTWWFLMSNIIFGLFYLGLLGLLIYKFVVKVKATGFMWNISFVYLLFQTVFCILMIIRWMDPTSNWGLYFVGADTLLDLWPSTWSFAALVLMAFFWFEVINQFADTKVQAFLSKKLQIPFWILVSIIILLPGINVCVLIFTLHYEPITALFIINFVAGMVVASFYIVVAVKALQVINRSTRLNVDKKSRVRALTRSKVSIIISTIIACAYPPCSFFLRYFVSTGNMYLILAAMYEETVLLGLIAFIQVWFMPNKSPGASSGQSRATRASLKPTTESIGTGSIAAKPTTEADATSASSSPA